MQWDPLSQYDRQVNHPKNIGRTTVEQECREKLKRVETHFWQAGWMGFRWVEPVMRQLADTSKNIMKE